MQRSADSDPGSVLHYSVDKAFHIERHPGFYALILPPSAKNSKGPSAATDDPNGGGHATHPLLQQGLITT